MVRPLLVLLHGSGYDEHQLDGAGLDPAGRFRAVAPRAPLALGDGTWSWFRSSRAAGIDPDTFTRALDALDSLVQQVCADEGLDPSTTVVGGFSQGGVLACALATRTRARWRPAACWSQCGAVAPEVVGTRRFDLSHLCGVPVLFQYGTADPLVPTADSERGIAMLQRAGAALTVCSYETGHRVSGSATADARTWLEAR